jgi:hypothetical protein
MPQNVGGDFLKINHNRLKSPLTSPVLAAFPTSEMQDSSKLMIGVRFFGLAGPRRRSTGIVQPPHRRGPGRSGRCSRSWQCRRR